LLQLNRPQPGHRLAVAASQPKTLSPSIGDSRYFLPQRDEPAPRQQLAAFTDDPSRMGMFFALGVRGVSPAELVAAPVRDSCLIEPGS
jgi:hypothetical protein